MIMLSMRATAKYFWLVTALFVAQVLLGIMTADYAVEGQGLDGISLAEYVPTPVTRSRHTQSWFDGLRRRGWRPDFTSLLFCCQEATLKYQAWSRIPVRQPVRDCGWRACGQWAAVQSVHYELDTNHWFGRQGCEEVDLGRVWQV